MDYKKLTFGGIAVVFFMACTVLLYEFYYPPFLTSLCAGMAVALVVFYLLEGAEGSVVSLPLLNPTGSELKFTGSGAVLIGITILGTGPIAKWQSVIEPDPQTWISLDNNGSHVPITVRDTTYSKNVTSFFKNTIWDIKKDSGSVILVGDGENMGTIIPRSLSEIGFFDSIEMQQGRNIQYSDELSSGDESSLSPVYPLRIRATAFRDEYNGFQILGTDGNILIEDALRTRNFEFFRHDEKHYLIFVVRAKHNDPVRPPWAVFGLMQIRPVLQSID